MVSAIIGCYHLGLLTPLLLDPLRFEFGDQPLLITHLRFGREYDVRGLPLPIDSVGWHRPAICNTPPVPGNVVKLTSKYEEPEESYNFTYYNFMRIPE